MIVLLKVCEVSEITHWFCSFQPLNILLSLSKIRYLPSKAEPWTINLDTWVRRAKTTTIVTIPGGRWGGVEDRHFTLLQASRTRTARLEYFLSAIRTWYPLWSYCTANSHENHWQGSTILSSQLSCGVNQKNVSCFGPANHLERIEWYLEGNHLWYWYIEWDQRSTITITPATSHHQGPQSVVLPLLLIKSLHAGSVLHWSGNSNGIMVLMVWCGLTRLGKASLVTAGGLAEQQNCPPSSIEIPRPFPVQSSHSAALCSSPAGWSLVSQ